MISQRKYVLELLEEYDMLGSKPSTIPVEVNSNLTLMTKDSLVDPTIFKQIIGRLMYVTLTRPDIAYTMHILSQFMEKLAQMHLKAAYKVLKYLK